MEREILDITEFHKQNVNFARDYIKEKKHLAPMVMVLGRDGKAVAILVQGSDNAGDALSRTLRLVEQSHPLAISIMSENWFKAFDKEKTSESFMKKYQHGDLEKEPTGRREGLSVMTADNKKHKLIYMAEIIRKKNGDIELNEDEFTPASNLGGRLVPDL